MGVTGLRKQRWMLPTNCEHIRCKNLASRRLYIKGEYHGAAINLIINACYKHSIEIREQAINRFNLHVEQGGLRGTRISKSYNS